MTKTTRRLVLAIVLLGGVGMVWAMNRGPSNGVAVVELFTSEGCSSCPPADRFFADLVKEKQDRVYLLAFHVDYWDTPQWRDAYSKKEFSARQEGYAQAAGSASVYTPQMVVNGTVGFVGRDEEQARREISTALGEKAAVMLKLETKLDNGQVRVDCTTDAAGVGKVLNVALVQRGIERKIGGGENTGRRLKHENVVREFQSVKTTALGTSLTLAMPADAAADQCSVIAYVQDNAMRVVGAGAVELAAAKK